MNDWQCVKRHTLPLNSPIRIEKNILHQKRCFKNVIVLPIILEAIQGCLDFKYSSCVMTVPTTVISISLMFIHVTLAVIELGWVLRAISCSDGMYVTKLLVT